MRMVRVEEGTNNKVKRSMGSLRTLGSTDHSKTTLTTKLVKRQKNRFSLISNNFHVRDGSNLFSGDFSMKANITQPLQQKLRNFGETIEENHSCIEKSNLEDKIAKNQPCPMGRVGNRNPFYVMSEAYSSGKESPITTPVGPKPKKLAKKIQLRLNTSPQIPSNPTQTASTGLETKMKQRSPSLQTSNLKSNCGLSPKVQWSFVKPAEGDTDDTNQSKDTSVFSLKAPSPFLEARTPSVRLRDPIQMKIKLNQKTLQFCNSSLSQSAVSQKDKGCVRVSLRQINPSAAFQGSDFKLISNPFFQAESGMSRAMFESTDNHRKMSGTSITLRPRIPSGNAPPDESLSSFEIKPRLPDKALVFLEQEPVGSKSSQLNPSADTPKVNEASRKNSEYKLDTVIDLAGMLEKSNPFQDYLVTRKSLNLRMV